MRSIKYQILVVLLCSLIIMVASFLAIFGWYMQDRVAKSTILKTKTDLATCMEIIDKTFPGSWSVQEGDLYKGNSKVSLNNDLVDHLSTLTGDTVTIFLGDTRVATTVRGSNGDRVIGTKVAANVAQTVLQDGQTYLGEAKVVEQLYQTGYAPLRSANGNIVGIFYVGIPNTYEQAILTRFLVNIAELGLALMIFVAFLTWFALQKVIISPLHNLMLSTRDVATGHLPEKIKVSGVKEIGELEEAFNLLVERIQVTPVELKTSSMDDAKDNPPKNESDIAHTPVNECVNTGVTTKNTADPVAPPLLNLKIAQCIGDKDLPKGLNQVTLDQIVEFIETDSGPFSSENVAEGVKLTRVTVRRYLDYLEQLGILKSQQKYGTVGRPVKIFILQ